MIGLLGGTFDPIHYGHLRPAHDASRQLGLRALHLVPVAVPPHRPAPVADAGHRLRMVELGVAEFPGLVADDREIRRGGVSYSVTTLESMRAEMGTEPICLLLGADAFAGLPSWHRWDDLSQLAHMVVMTRPGFTASGTDAPAWARPRICASPAELTRRPAGGVCFVTVAPLDVSASRLRQAIAHGAMPAAAELPPAVWDYIRHHHLYRSHTA
jgi:nicotinate-nucleotide adenylyltransferase